MPSSARNWLLLMKSTTGRAASKTGCWGWMTRKRGGIEVFTFLTLLTAPVRFLLAQEVRPTQAVQCLGCKEPAKAIEKGRTQAPNFMDEIALEHCDRLPMVKVQVDGTEKHLLLDTAATSILNRKSFPAANSRDVRIASWTGITIAQAEEVLIGELSIANHKMRGVRLPAVDLSAIGKACGHAIDGIFGVDLIQQMGLTIDLQRHIGLLKGKPIDTRTTYAEMEKEMHECNMAFNLGKAEELKECFDPEVVLYTPLGEFRGRDQVMEYLQKRYLRFAPNADYRMTVHDVRLFGDVLWYSYDFSIDTPEEHPSGHGTAMCLRSEGRWRIVNMHNSMLQPEPQP
jgi:SnoaL-like domain/Retroviral aspartyl protease